MLRNGDQDEGVGFCNQQTALYKNVFAIGVIYCSAVDMGDPAEPDRAWHFFAAYRMQAFPIPWGDCYGLGFQTVQPWDGDVYLYAKTPRE